MCYVHRLEHPTQCTATLYGGSQCPNLCHAARCRTHAQLYAYCQYVKRDNTRCGRQCRGERCGQHTEHRLAWKAEYMKQVYETAREATAARAAPTVEPTQ
jgi:hypothetical protein